jgi:hypothetical protein
MGWDLRAGAEADEAKRRAVDAELKVDRATRAMEELEKTLAEKTDGLSLICRAMWELMRESHGYSEQTLMDKVREVDLLDGTLDGKVRKLRKECPRCRRVMSRKLNRCLYCGTEEHPDSVFDSLPTIL